MSFQPYLDILHDLLSYREFRIGLHLFSVIVLVCIGVLVVLAVLHMLYYLGHKTPIYRRKPPVDGWNRRFFSSLTAILVILLFVVWGADALITIHT